MIAVYYQCADYKCIFHVLWELTCANSEIRQCFFPGFAHFFSFEMHFISIYIFNVFYICFVVHWGYLFLQRMILIILRKADFLICLRYQLSLKSRSSQQENIFDKNSNENIRFQHLNVNTKPPVELAPKVIFFCLVFLIFVICKKAYLLKKVRLLNKVIFISACVKLVLSIWLQNLLFCCSWCAYQKKTFQKFWKTLFIPSKAIFVLEIFTLLQFFPFFTVSRVNRPDGTV